MITIKVVYSSSGKPAKGVCVSLGFSSLFRGVTDTEYTDDNGEAHFNNDPAMARFKSTAPPNTKATCAGASWFTSDSS